MKKKLLFILVCIICLLSLCACGSHKTTLNITINGDVNQNYTEEVDYKKNPTYSMELVFTDCNVSLMETSTSEGACTIEDKGSSFILNYTFTYKPSNEINITIKAVDFPRVSLVVPTHEDIDLAQAFEGYRVSLDGQEVTTYNFSEAGSYAFVLTKEGASKGTTIIAKDAYQLDKTSYDVEAGQDINLDTLLNIKDYDYTIYQDNTILTNHTIHLSKGTYTYTVCITTLGLEKYPSKQEITINAMNYEKPTITVPEFDITAGDTVDLMTGVSAIDTIDGDISSKVNFNLYDSHNEEIFLWNSEYTFQNAGTYTLKYSVSNSHNLIEEVTVTLDIKNMALVGTSVLYNADFSKDAYWTANMEDVLSIEKGVGTLRILESNDVKDQYVRSADFTMEKDIIYRLDVNVRFEDNHPLTYEIHDSQTDAVIMTYTFCQDGVNDTYDQLPYGNIEEKTRYSGFLAPYDGTAYVILYVGGGKATYVTFNSIDVHKTTTYIRDITVDSVIDPITEYEGKQFLMMRGFYQAMTYSKVWGYMSSMTGEFNKKDGPYYNDEGILYCKVTFRMANQYIILMTDNSFVPNDVAICVNVK